MENYAIHPFSYFAGLMSGMILRWTDIIPIIGGVIIGFSIKKIPNIIKFEELPVPVQSYYNYLSQLTNQQIDKVKKSVKKARSTKE